MERVFELVFEKLIPFKDKVTFLQSAACHKMICSNPEDIGTILNKTRLLLESKQTRLEGLLLLHILLSQCSAEVFLAQGYTWLQLALQVLKGNDGVRHKGLACAIMSSIIKELALYPALRKEVIESSLPSLLDTLLGTSIEDEWVTEATQCLSACLQEFPSVCGLRKETIEKFLIQQFENLQCKDIEPVAECFSRLPACCERSCVSVVYLKNWQKIFSTLLETLQIILNSLCLNVIENAPDFVGSAKVTLPPVPEDPCSEPLVQSRRFQAVSRCIAKMLSSHSQHAVKIPVEPLLELICFYLSVSQGTLISKGSHEAIMLASVLPTVQIGILSILESLILSSHHVLVPHGFTVVKLFVHLLRITCFKEDAGRHENWFGLLRSTVIKVLRTWVDVLKSNSCLERHIDIIVLELLKDIGYHADSTSLLKSSVSKSKCNDERISMKNDKLHVLVQTQRKQTRSSTCIEAIRALSSLIYSASSLFNPDLEKIIHDVVVKILLNIQHHEELPFSVLYTDEDCRSELYNLLLSIILAFKPPFLSSIQPALHIFSVGCQKESVKVARSCVHGLSVCSAIIHPQRSSSQISSKSMPSEKDKRISITDVSSLLNNSTTSWQSNHTNTKTDQFVNMPKKIHETVALVNENHVSHSLSDTVKNTENESASHNYNERGDCCDYGETDMQILPSHDNSESAVEAESEEYAEEEDEDDDDEDEEVEDEEEVRDDDEKDFVSPVKTNAVSKKLHIGKHNLKQQKIYRNDKKIIINCSKSSEKKIIKQNLVTVNENGYYSSDSECSVKVKSKKRATENSNEAPSPKRQHIEVSPHDSADDDNNEAKSAQEMMNDFYPYSPDESQS